MSELFSIIGLISVSIAMVMAGESNPVVHPAAWVMLALGLVSLFAAWLFNQPYER